jgi:hypothetical protein
MKNLTNIVWQTLQGQLYISFCSKKVTPTIHVSLGQARRMISNPTHRRRPRVSGRVAVVVIKSSQPRDNNNEDPVSYVRTCGPVRPLARMTGSPFTRGVRRHSTSLYKMKQTRQHTRTSTTLISRPNRRHLLLLLPPPFLLLFLGDL